ncbi:hypothetical protein J6590_044847 [Homalodisca vitripennis]|nr:hypothetical protein J6590_044847 [Homalodisca vitripennis]
MSTRPGAATGHELAEAGRCQRSKFLIILKLPCELSALSRADPVRRTHWTGIVTLPGVKLFHE